MLKVISFLKMHSFITLCYRGITFIEEREALRHYCNQLTEEYLIKLKFDKIDHKYLKAELKFAYKTGKDNYLRRLQSYHIIINPDQKIKITVKK